MKAYIIKIVGAALVGTFSEYLVPGEWKKYVKLISGILMLSVLLIPFKADIGQIFPDENTSAYQAEGEELLYESIQEQLEKDVAADIEKRIHEEFSEKVTAEAEIQTNEEGKIKGVKRILLKGNGDIKITERLKFVYGAEEIIWIKG